MRVSNFRKFKKTLPRQIANFSVEADKDVGDDEWEMPIHRYSAAEILVWILNKTGATLRKSQMVEAWVSVVRQCWNMQDFSQYNGRNHQAILSEIEYFVQKAQYKKNKKAETCLAEKECKERDQHLILYAFGSVKRIRRAITA